MMTLEEVWENLRKDPEIKATMEEVEKSYKLFKKIENLNKEFELAQEHNEKTVEYWQNECSQLKQQLAEKNELLVATKWKVDDLEKQLSDKDKEIKDTKDVSRRLIRTCGKANCYGKNQTAIEELEKVKDKISYYLLKFDYFTPKQSNQVNKMIKAIDQQIKSLKGGK